MEKNLLPRFVFCKMPALVCCLAVLHLSVAAAPSGEAGPTDKFFQQPANITVRGKVVGPQGPLEGVTVRVDGSNTATTTNASGDYTIVAPERGTLIFSSAGYNEQRVPVARTATHDVTLAVRQNDLQEVVVTGYRSQTRGSIVGSVASVSGQEVADIPTDNLSNSLSGRLTGVTISQAAGTPGMSSAIRIRAQGSLTGTAPLFVIDGVVSDQFAFDGLSPNEVQSVTILKDAASAAIYGARAANGVVLVTTKRGREGAPRFNYNGIYGIQSPTKIPETLNAFEHASAINHQLKYIGVAANDPRYYSSDELEYFRNNSFKWLDELWRNPYTTQHNMDVSGGSANVKYFLGGSYNYSSGSFDNIDFKKFNLRGNVDVNLSRNLKLSLDLNTDTRNTSGPSWDVNNLRYEDLYKAIAFRSAMVPPYINGEPVGNFVEWHPGSVLNLEAGYNRRRWTGLNAQAAVNYTVPFIKGMSVRASYNRYTRDIYQKNFNLPYNMTLFNLTGTNNHIIGNTPVGIRPRVQQEFLNSRYENIWRYQVNAQINYKRNFGRHGVDALFVYEQAEDYTTNFNAQRNEFISPVLDQYAGGSPVNSVANGSEFENGRLSYVGVIGYNYAQKYLVEGSFRYDASAKFAPQNRVGSSRVDLQACKLEYSIVSPK